ncbi:MAG TPA: sugar kinase [Burkholderiales bacterium]
MEAFDIVSLGEPMYEFSQIPGEESRYLQGFGGDTMNCAIAAARQGARVAYVTRLGDDEFGRQFLDLWKREGVDASGVGIDADAHTAVYFITHGPGGHVFSYLRKGSAASRMTPAQLPAGLIASARFFHTSGISQAISEGACDSVFAAIGIARKAGAQVVYDCNLRPRLWPAARAAAVIRATIPLADYFLLSMEDAQALCAMQDPDAILDWCHGAGARIVALKLGAEGVIASDSQRRERLAGIKINCVDATGAGDCFAGALMAQLAAGRTFWDGLRYANAAAALTTTGYGAVAPLPRPDAVKKLLSGGIAA